MQFNGFGSVREYESAAARAGFTTRRVPFHNDGGASFFALVTSPPGHPTGTSVESWDLFAADETAHLLDGVINGHSANYLGKLAAHGYFPDNAPEVPPAPPAAALHPDESGQFRFSF